jgi:dTDP-4-amino-4,6-dideoxygalactose transaminase
MLVVNDNQFEERSEIIWEKGTNRSAFFRGEVDKYGWVDVGSSFLPSELNAAFLYAQLEHLEEIQEKRLKIWETYQQGLKDICKRLEIQQPELPNYATNNAHMYYLVCKSEKQRNRLISHLKNQDIHSVFHYLSLHKSKFYKDKHDGRELQQADRYMDCLVRLPFYYELSKKEQEYIIETINDFR